ncbi:hypothetical protein VDGE_04677 [Verticillium dahliae]|uniref:Uncharacterized protein n=1 Tax=Verticillium dahliae TaxID=27337 RepID=A0A444S6G8_VERDA|nr:hypothetical protein VDGE_04677 [Verticillium dahliae]
MWRFSDSPQQWVYLVFGNAGSHISHHQPRGMKDCISDAAAESSFRWTCERLCQGASTVCVRDSRGVQLTSDRGQRLRAHRVAGILQYRHQHISADLLLQHLGLIQGPLTVVLASEDLHYRHKRQASLQSKLLGSSSGLKRAVHESMTNDEQMFRRIREEYETARRENPWHVSIPSPKWFSKFWHRFVASLPDLPRVAAMFKPMKKAWTGHLYQVSNGDFVRFNLVPIRLRLSPRNFKTKELPPQKEIEELRYIYDPRPMEVEYYDIPLDHLMEPGQHLDDFWLTSFPTKLREPLVRRGGVCGGIPREPCIGWGIRMNEEVSKIYILRLLHIAVVLVLVVTILHGNSRVGAEM